MTARLAPTGPRAVAPSGGRGRPRSSEARIFQPRHGGEGKNVLASTAGKERHGLSRIPAFAGMTARLAPNWTARVLARSCAV